jgi:hypothetical protein
MEMALEAVAANDPIWLRSNLLPHWYRRYEQWPAGYRKTPRSPVEIEALILAAGRDGWHLLQAIERSHASALSRLPEIEGLRSEWRRQFREEEQDLKLRALCSPECSHCSNFINPDPMGKEAGIASNGESISAQSGQDSAIQ